MVRFLVRRKTSSSAKPHNDYKPAPLLYNTSCVTVPPCINVFLVAPLSRRYRIAVASKKVILSVARSRSCHSPQKTENAPQ